MKENPHENDINRINFDSLGKRSVHTKNGDLLGIIESAGDDHLVVKKNIRNVIYYRIPKHRCERWDGHALWLNITERQACKKYLLASDNDEMGFETMTFRLNESVMDNVRIESKEKAISMNNLVNQILRNFIEWDDPESESGMVDIPRSVLSELFNKKTDEEIIDMAKSVGKNAIYNTVLFMEGKRDLSSFLLWVETEMNDHSLNVRHVIEGDTHRYIIKHNLGYKFSLYYKTIIDSICSDFFGENVTFTLSDALLLFQFKYRV